MCNCCFIYLLCWLEYLREVLEVLMFLLLPADDFHSCILRFIVRVSLSLSCVTDLLDNVNVKVWTLAIVPLIWVRLVTSSALQSLKCKLIGMRQCCRSALCGHPLSALTDNWTHSAACRHTIAPISHTRPSPRSRSYFSFPIPLRAGGWVGQSTVG